MTGRLASTSWSGRVPCPGRVSWRRRVSGPGRVSWIDGVRRPGGRSWRIGPVGWLLVPAVAGTGVILGSPLLAVTAPLVIGLVLVELRRRRRWRRDLARADALPAAIDQLIQQLHSGASLRRACGSLAPTSSVIDAEALRPMTVALAEGATLTEAVETLADDDDPSIRLLVTTLQLLARNGGPAIPSLRRLRHTLVGRAHRRRRAQAVAASATSSAGLLAVAPALFAVVLAGAEPALATFYVVEIAGAACGTASVLLSAAGWWWMQAAVAHSVGRGT